MTGLDGLAGSVRSYKIHIAESEESKAARTEQLLRRLARLSRESLRLYNELPASKDFHASHANWRVVDGSNRAGKTLSVGIEIARAVTDQDPYHKYPARNGKALLVGLDNDHLSNPMYETLFQPGPFWRIRDLSTGFWRSLRVDPGDPTRLDASDLLRRSEWRPAEPLIPERFITEIAWEDKKKRVPRLVRLTTGWEMLWRSSNGKPPQGIKLNLAWFDEELDNPEFFTETLPRLTDGSGVGIWSATPQTATPQLYELRDRADHGDPSVQAFTLLIADNPYLPAEAKEELYRALSEDERTVRWFGRYAILGRTVYPTYTPQNEHGCEEFAIPDDWTRYVVLDPGRQHCGTVLAAVDPDEKHVWVYDAFDLRHGDANKWADKIAERQGKWKFEAVVCDGRMGIQHSSGQASTVAEHYYEALLAAGVRPRTEGGMGGFFAGSDDVPAREEALLDWMRIRPSGIGAGTPKLQVVRSICPELHSQIVKATYTKKGEDTGKEVRSNIRQDLLVCMEYLAAFNPYYQEPEQAEDIREDRVWQLWQDRQEKKRQRSSRSSIVLG